MTTKIFAFVAWATLVLCSSQELHAQGLTGSLTTPASSQNLTSLGSADWAHWGLYSAGSFDRKAGVPAQLGNFTVVNGEAGSVANFAGGPVAYSWNDGAPDSSISGTTTGVYITGLNRGFQITSPADTTPRTITIFLGVYSGTGKLVAHLSDNSAPDFVDTSLSGSGSLAGSYKLQYAAGSAGRKLSISWTLASGDGNVNLRSAALAAGGNVSPPPDFTVGVSSPNPSGIPGSVVGFTVNVGSLNGFTGTVGLAVSGAPPNATAVFNPATIANGAGASSLGITIPVSAAPAAYTLTITGTSGALSHTASAVLQVSGPPDFTISLLPASQTVTAGTQTSFTATVTPQNGFGGAVTLSVSGLPTGVTPSFSPLTLPAAGGSSSITLTASSNTPPGGSTFTITGTSGAISHSANANLTVTAAGAGTLTGTLSSSNGIQNLTGLGSADWAHWGLSSSTSFDHKTSGGSQISNFTVINGVAPSVANFSGSAIGYSWTDGTPTSATINTTSGVYISGAGRGFQFTVPADTTQRTLTVYLGVFAGQGRLTAHLSDASATDYVDTSAASGAASYALHYQAASAGQTLTITWTLINGSGNVNLQAAALTVDQVTDFSVGLLPTTLMVSAGNSITDTVSITPRNGFSEQVTLGVTGLPANATATFLPPSISGGTGSSTLSISVAPNTPAMTYPLSVSGTAQALKRTQALGLQVIGPPDFVLTVTPQVLNVQAGSTGVYNITVSPLNGFTAAISLSITGIPGDSFYTFTPSTIPGGSESATLTLNIPATEFSSSYTPTITATSGAITHAANLTLQVTGQDFTLGVQPASQSVSSGSGTSFTTSIAPQNGFAGTVSLSVSGAPPGASATFTPTSIVGGGSSTLAVLVPKGTATGTYSLTLTAASGPLSHVATATLQVAGPQDFSLSLQKSFYSVPGNGGSASYTLNTSATSSYTGPVSLSVSGLPSGVTSVWSSQIIPGSSGTATVTFTMPSGVAAGSYPLIFSGTASALIRTARGILLIMPAGSNSGPALSGALLSPGRSQNLSALGTADWAHWGYLSSSSFDHMAGISPQISNVSIINGTAANVANFTGNPVNFTWTGGVPDATVSNTDTGIYISGAGRGFALTVPADTTPRTLNIFVGVYAGHGKLVAHLSDSSTADFVDTSLNPGGSQAGQYTISYSAASAGQTLTVSWTLASGGGNVNLQAAALAQAGSTGGPQFYVSPSGSANGDGSIANPWDIVTALNQPSAVQPGSTIWLRSGMYKSGTTQFASYLAGTATQPILVRQYPGERATIDGGIAIYGPYTWYWDFEVFSSSIDRGSGAPRPECIDTYGGSAGVKLINLELHDCLQGLGFWVNAVNGEAAGNLIYYNGEYSLARGVGHGIYTQNDTGTKQLTDNIVFEQFDIGLQAFGSSSAYVRGYNLDGNVSFNNGQLYGALTDNVLFGGSGALNQLDNISVQNTFTYSMPSLNQAESQLGWSFDGQNGSVVARNNYWMGGNAALELWNWTNATFTNNTVYSQASLDLLVNTNGATGYLINNNTYFGSTLFNFNGASMGTSQWLASSGFDTDSLFSPGRPTGVWTFVRPNGYEDGRANIIVYNWDLTSSVSIDLNGILSPGDTYVVRDAENYFHTPIVAGTWQPGTPVVIPMTGLTPAPTVGSTNAPPVHTAPEFGVFIVSRH